MKKRIFITMHYMEIGGAETALIGLMNAIDYSQYDVDLFLYSHRGEMMAFIPQEVNLLPEIPIYAQIERPMKGVLKDGYIRMVLARLKAKWQTKRYEKMHPARESAAGLQYTANAVVPFLPYINPTVDYDLAISFLNPHNIVAYKVRAKKKICWIHTDYSVVDVNADLELPVWSSYDHVMSISEDVTKAFLSTFPSLKDKIILMENILSPTFVRQRAEEFDALHELKQIGGKSLTIITIGRFCWQKNLENIPDILKEMLNLLSVGRFSYAKNYDNVPDICRRMILDEMIDIKWFIIGYGNEEHLIRQRITEAGMDDHVFILGKRTNPYPYIKACDIYVQPSRYEGKSVTVREAQILCKPVVVTNYPTASSQIKDGIDGVIVPLDNEGCARGIVDFIRNKDLQERIKSYLQTHDYGNEGEVEKLYQLL